MDNKAFLEGFASSLQKKAFGFVTGFLPKAYYASLLLPHQDDEAKRLKVQNQQDMERREAAAAEPKTMDEVIAEHGVKIDPNVLSTLYREGRLPQFYETLAGF